MIKTITLKKADKIVNWLMSILSMVLVCGFILFIKQGWDIKPGQIWVYTYNSNPFETPTTETNEILAVKGGWVQFMCNGYTSSERINYFIVNSKRIK